MVHLCAQGKANATADKSVSDENDTAFLKMNDTKEMANNLEAAKVVSDTGGSEEAYVETTLNEQSLIVSRDDGTVVQEENNKSEVEMLNEECSLKEHEYNQTEVVVGEEGEIRERNEEDATGNSKDYLENGENMKEKNEGGAAGVDKDNKGDIMEEDAIGNNEDNDQKKGQNKEEKNEGDTAGVDKDNKRDTLGKDEYEGNEEEKNTEKLEAVTNQMTKISKKGITRKRKGNENTEEKGEIKQALKKVASESKVKEYCGNLASKADNDQDSKGTETGNLVSTCDDDECTTKITSGDEAKMSPEKMASEGRDSPELSEKKNNKEKEKKSPELVDSMGMIFMCNSETKKDCYRYKVLGLPANKREMVEKVLKGMKLFLYDVDLKLMYGIYKAAAHGGFCIEPKAFKSQFPSQVRFSIVDDCLPLAEEKFREVIKKNYYTKTKFHCKLTSEQVKNLCKLFISASKKSGLQLKSETSTMAKRSRIKGWCMDQKRQPEHVRQTKWVEEPRYLSHPHLLERDVVTTPLMPLAWPQNSLSFAVGQSHNRTLEIGVYGWDTMTHNHDTFREGRLVESHDSYRLDKLLKNPDIYRGDALAENYDYPRQDGLFEHREYQLVNLEAGQQDVVNHHPYALYSGNMSSQDPVYLPGTHPKCNPPPGLLPEYRLGDLSSAYSSTKDVPLEYHSSADSLSGFHYHQPIYRY